MNTDTYLGGHAPLPIKPTELDDEVHEQLEKSIRKRQRSVNSMWQMSRVFGDKAARLGLKNAVGERGYKIFQLCHTHLRGRCARYGGSELLAFSAIYEDLAEIYPSHDPVLLCWRTWTEYQSSTLARHSNRSRLPARTFGPVTQQTAKMHRKGLLASRENIRRLSLKEIHWLHREILPFRQKEATGDSQTISGIRKTLLRRFGFDLVDKKTGEIIESKILSAHDLCTLAPEMAKEYLSDTEILSILDYVKIGRAGLKRQSKLKAVGAQ